MSTILIVDDHSDAIKAADHDDGRARGADAYFIKPFSPLQVVSWVRSKIG
ncbi:MAG: hypothetical protein JZU64_16665 [Rhodoferax sp.]|jgi:CheY-like chemotaxis protein|nr:hypothetical protein [Rhodoferax sp.]